MGSKQGEKKPNEPRKTTTKPNTHIKKEIKKGRKKENQNQTKPNKKRKGEMN